MCKNTCSLDGTWQSLRSIPIERGQRRYLQGITLTAQHAFGTVNLIIDWNPKEDAPRYWVLDQPANRHAWRRGRKRFWIEPTNRDFKSAGFDLEHSGLTDASRLSALILAMAVTWLWVAFIGQWVTQQGLRTRLEAAHKRDDSLFRLGRDWVQRALVMGWPIPVGFTVRPGSDEPPPFLMRVAPVATGWRVGDAGRCRGVREAWPRARRRWVPPNRWQRHPTVVGMASVRDGKRVTPGRGGLGAEVRDSPIRQGATQPPSRAGHHPRLRGVCVFICHERHHDASPGSCCPLMT